MDGYARELRTGDRSAIASRHDRNGAYLIRNGIKTFRTYDQIVEHYQKRWSPISVFEWQDLSFEPIGPDAVVVIGAFVGNQAGRPTKTVSYTGLLRRQDGQLRIRVEDETLVALAEQD